MRENGFRLKKSRSRQYSSETITDADYTDDPWHLANTSGQAYAAFTGTGSKRHWFLHELR